MNNATKIGSILTFLSNFSGMSSTGQSWSRWSNPGHGFKFCGISFQTATFRVEFPTQRSSQVLNHNFKLKLVIVQSL